MTAVDPADLDDATEAEPSPPAAPRHGVPRQPVRVEAAGSVVQRRVAELIRDRYLTRQSGRPYDDPRPWPDQVAADIDAAGLLRPDGATDLAEHLRADLSASVHLALLVAEIDLAAEDYPWTWRPWSRDRPPRRRACG